MGPILIEGILVVALLVVGGAFVKHAIGSTSVGRRLRQTRNRKEIDRAAELVCPIHGLQREEDLVRLESGEVLCPHCYRDVVLPKLEP